MLAVDGSDKCNVNVKAGGQSCAITGVYGTIWWLTCFELLWQWTVTITVFSNQSMPFEIVEQINK